MRTSRVGLNEMPKSNADKYLDEIPQEAGPNSDRKNPDLLFGIWIKVNSETCIILTIAKFVALIVTGLSQEKRRVIKVEE